MKPRPLCVHCGLYDVQGWRPTTKFCSRACSSKYRWQRVRTATKQDDYPPHIIDRKFDLAKAEQRRHRWQA
jgi:hypothetical protein